MATTAASILYPRIVKQTGPVCNAVVLFLHGSGDTGDGVSEWVTMASRGEFHFPHAKVLYPTAPLRHYTPMGGAMSNVWFDRMQISPTVPEHSQSVEAMCANLSTLIQEQVANGIPKSRIIIGGFSMGGAMALHLTYRFHRDVAGVFALSSFLNNGSAVYKELESVPKNSPLPPLFYCQGEKDELALPIWAENTFSQLSAVGVQGVFKKYPIYHELNKAELGALQTWIKGRIPES
ncbi:lysophospholipase-like protein 1 isoform X2 [Mizuhopecten yessoensis]|uniref:palmitoyl-protein hydrolase n=1 Tax=Mizuhopecten yessoensis TaxID=6573 RepID=A0A210QNP8_MIZYE|nr:lysophospholipase-like protein 1 isoform X2 [Mizuhopecten yessoensis]OWF50351.1 Lysophospholipase-like protein 1 [Mizuhopecten yessoensis]